MRHRVYGKKLGRNKNERTALFKSLVQSLFTYGTIQTSEAKAKAIKGMVDKIVNLAKNGNQASLHTYLANSALQERLVKEIAPKLGSRVSGYTNLVRMGARVGDRTMMVKMSLIGVGQLKPIEKVTSKRVEATKKISEKKGRTGQSVRSAKSTGRGKLRLSKKKK